MKTLLLVAIAAFSLSASAKEINYIESPNPSINQSKHSDCVDRCMAGGSGWVQCTNSCPVSSGPQPTTPK